MTPEEKMVWAAAFACSNTRHGMADVAVFDAWRAVDQFRGFKPRAGAEENEAVDMHREMRGGK